MDVFSVVIELLWCHVWVALQGSDAADDIARSFAKGWCRHDSNLELSLMVEDLKDVRLRHRLYTSMAAMPASGKRSRTSAVFFLTDNTTTSSLWIHHVRSQSLIHV